MASSPASTSVASPQGALSKGASFRFKRAARWAPLALATLAIAHETISRVLAKLAHPGASLDDAYIHFQYARAFAEGHPFRYAPGDPVSSGATSFLWPAVLAVFHLVGFRGESIMWPAWALSFAALGALAYEAYALAKPLAGRPASIGAGAMVLAFGGFVWGAGSGMEVVPFAWLIAFATRRAAEWAETSRELRTRRMLFALIGLAVAAPLARPEGALTALALGGVVAFFPRAGGIARRAEALAFAAAALGPSILLLLLTGKATSSTAQVKLLFGNPYYAVLDTALANARLLLSTILDGEVWSTEFLPKGGASVACAGIVALVWRGHTTKRPLRALLIALTALSMFLPCFYVTFLWNRLRYLWPFATGWLIGLACLARTVSGAVSRIDARAGAITSALVAGLFAGALAVRLEWVIEDVAQSASGISRQQVALGHWAATNLPNDARIGVNDTGAIAYFGGRKTFDVVGLTTPGEARYWVAGSGSRLEHYERVRKTNPSSLPTHFIVYPEWMGCEPVLGRALHEAVVTDSTILGGQVMRVYEARWDHLGSGDLPWTKLEAIHDTIDVADLESEAEHGYELLGAREGEETAQEGNAPLGSVVVDGGRINRHTERFFAKLPSGGRLVAVARVESAADTELTLRVAGTVVSRVAVDAGPWTEAVFEIPEGARGERRPIEITSSTRFASFHYWFGTPAVCVGADCAHGPPSVFPSPP